MFNTTYLWKSSKKLFYFKEVGLRSYKLTVVILHIVGHMRGCSSDSPRFLRFWSEAFLHVATTEEHCSQGTSTNSSCNPTSDWRRVACWVVSGFGWLVDSNGERVASALCPLVECSRPNDSFEKNSKNPRKKSPQRLTLKHSPSNSNWEIRIDMYHDVRSANGSEKILSMSG